MPREFTKAVRIDRSHLLHEDPGGLARVLRCPQRASSPCQSLRQRFRLVGKQIQQPSKSL